MLNGYREKALCKLDELGLPTKKDDAFRYFPLRRFYERELDYAEGEWQSGLSLDEALTTYSAVIEKAFADALAGESNPFALLALQREHRFIYVPPGRTERIEAPSDGNLLLFVGKGARVELVQRGSGTSTLSHWRVVQEAGSEVTVSTRYEEMAWRLDALRFFLKRDAKLRLFTYSEGGDGIRQDIRVELLEENSEADLRGLARLHGKSEHHTYIHVHHAAPHCRSNQHFKTVLFDRARASFEGKIYVEPVAQQTEAYQLSNTLLLGDGVMNSKPNLEIFADDVKASHGATVAQLDPQELLYLRSRGVTEAKELSTLR